MVVLVWFYNYRSVNDNFLGGYLCALIKEYKTPCTLNDVESERLNRVDGGCLIRGDAGIFGRGLIFPAKPTAEHVQ